MPRQVNLVVGAVAILAAAFAWWALPRADRDKEATTHAAPPPAAAAKIPATSERSAGRGPVASSGRESSRSLDERPFTEVRAELERLADAGDAHAALRLGRTLAHCNGYVPITNAQLEDFVVHWAAVGTFVTADEGEQAPETLLETLKLGLAQKQIDCHGVAGLDDADARTKALHWIERSAALGNADAQALYGATAFSSYEARNALVDAESLREHKQRATSYLQKSLAQGDALALLELHRSYSAGTLHPASAEAAYAHLYAYSLTPRAAELAPELLRQTLAAHAAILDPQALERARDEGRRLAACCGGAATGAP